MSEEITWLEVPEDATQHAERFGAQQDPETDQWYVIGHFHRELTNYLPRPKSKRAYERAPPCPVCGSSTRRRVNRWGNPFWGCSTWASTHCHGIVDYEDYLAHDSGLTPASDAIREIVDRLIWLRKVEQPEPDQPRLPRRKLTPEVKALWPEILGLAFDAFGSTEAVVLWLKRPNITFGGTRPLDVIGTIEGCQTVRKLLTGIRSRRTPDADAS